MPRKKKSTKQKQKVSQKVIQQVKVIVGGREKRSKRQYRRREPEVETISSKTLAPVFIQPPVQSILPTQRDPVLPTEAYVVAQPFYEEPRGQRLGGIPKTAEELHPHTFAEPLFKTSKEILQDIDFVTPVANKKEHIRENAGIFYEKTLSDTVLQPSNRDKIVSQLTEVDYQPPRFVENPLRDVAAFTQSQIKKIEEEPKSAVKARKPTQKQILLQEYANALGYTDPEELMPSVKRKTAKELEVELEKLKRASSPPLSEITQTTKETKSNIVNIFK